MHHKNSIAAILAAAGFMLAVNASAQVYVGASVGEADWNTDCSGTTSCTTSDSSYKVYGGYNFTPQWAIEAGYFDLGTVKAAVPSGLGPIATSIQGTGYEVVGVLNTHLNKDWSTFVRFGVAQIKAEASASVGTINGSFSNNSAQAVIGLGVIYNICQNVGIRADIDSRKVDLGVNSGGSVNVTNFSIGVQGSF